AVPFTPPTSTSTSAAASPPSRPQLNDSSSTSRPAPSHAPQLPPPPPRTSADASPLAAVFEPPPPPDAPTVAARRQSISVSTRKKSLHRAAAVPAAPLPPASDSGASNAAAPAPKLSNPESKPKATEVEDDPDVRLFKNDLIFKIRSFDAYIAPPNDALCYNSERKCFFVSTQYATPFSRTAVNGFVPRKYFDVVDLNSPEPASQKKTAKAKPAAAAAPSQGAESAVKQPAVSSLTNGINSIAETNSSTKPVASSVASLSSTKAHAAPSRLSRKSDDGGLGAAAGTNSRHRHLNSQGIQNENRVFGLQRSDSEPIVTSAANNAALGAIPEEHKISGLDSLWMRARDAAAAATGRPKKLEATATPETGARVTPTPFSSSQSHSTSRTSSPFSQSLPTHMDRHPSSHYLSAPSLPDVDLSSTGTPDNANQRVPRGLWKRQGSSARNPAPTESVLSTSPAPSHPGSPAASAGRPAGIWRWPSFGKSKSSSRAMTPQLQQQPEQQPPREHHSLVGSPGSFRWTTPQPARTSLDSLFFDHAHTGSVPQQDIPAVPLPIRRGTSPMGRQPHPPHQQPASFLTPPEASPPQRPSSSLQIRREHQHQEAQANSRRAAAGSRLGSRASEDAADLHTRGHHLQRSHLGGSASNQQVEEPDDQAYVRASSEPRERRMSFMKVLSSLRPQQDKTGHYNTDQPSHQVPPPSQAQSPPPLQQQQQQQRFAGVGLGRRRTATRSTRATLSISTLAGVLGRTRANTDHNAAASGYSRTQSHLFSSTSSSHPHHYAGEATSVDTPGLPSSALWTGRTAPRAAPFLFFRNSAGFSARTPAAPTTATPSAYPYSDPRSATSSGTGAAAGVASPRSSLSPTSVASSFAHHHPHNIHQNPLFHVHVGASAASTVNAHQPPLAQRRPSQRQSLPLADAAAVTTSGPAAHSLVAASLSSRRSRTPSVASGSTTSVAVPSAAGGASATAAVVAAANILPASTAALAASVSPRWQHYRDGGGGGPLPSSLSGLSGLSSGRSGAGAVGGVGFLSPSSSDSSSSDSATDSVSSSSCASLDPLPPASALSPARYAQFGHHYHQSHLQVHPQQHATAELDPNTAAAANAWLTGIARRASSRSSASSSSARSLGGRARPVIAAATASSSGVLWGPYASPSFSPSPPPQPSASSPFFTVAGSQPAVLADYATASPPSAATAALAVGPPSLYPVPPQPQPPPTELTVASGHHHNHHHHQSPRRSNSHHSRNALRRRPASALSWQPGGNGAAAPQPPPPPPPPQQHQQQQQQPSTAASAGAGVAATRFNSAGSSRVRDRGSRW
ncbi:hypothetical protein HK405_006746, partial [Cladochytrium tenue]